MSLGSLYFTPPFTLSDRQVFFDALGLSDLDFQYFETVDDGPILAALRVVKGVIHPLLNPAELSQLEANEIPTFVTNHSKGQLACLPLKREASIWRDLFPFPFNTLSHRFEPVRGIEFTVSPMGFAHKIQALAAELSQLESVMAQFEVSVLFVRGQYRVFPALFHYVRSKRIRVGTSLSLKELALKVDAGDVDRAGIRQFFGTRVAWLELDLRHPQGDPLDYLVLKLRETLSHEGLECAGPQAHLPGQPGINL